MGQAGKENEAEHTLEQKCHLDRERLNRINLSFKQTFDSPLSVTSTDIHKYQKLNLLENLMH